MNQMEQSKKFVCKYCNKRYPCGKSLGGHIRIHFNHNKHNHTINTSLEDDVDVDLDDVDDDDDDDDDDIELINVSSKVNLGGGGGSGGGGGQSSYGLRENPKKTRRFSIPTNFMHSSKQQLLLCKECGKGFQSLKALCGHMACHSEKDHHNNKLTKLKHNNNNNNNHNHNLAVMDSQSETETSTPSKRRRSRRMKYKTVVGAYDSSSFNGNYSSLSTDMELEQEEVAMCLIMLSRDSGFRKTWNSVPDSSDNNSVVLETKSPSIDMRMKKIGETLKCAEIEESENSDSGYFNNGPKKVSSDDASVDGNYEFTRPNAGFGSGFNDFEEMEDAELGEKLKKFKFKKVGGLSAAKNKEFFSDKRKEYGCLVCNKVFHSHRSLWGHQASHSRISGCFESMYGSGENSVENENDPIPVNNSSKKIPVNNNNIQKKTGSKKMKGHQCPICFRMFKSGQALGGHKRSHFMGGSADNGTVVINHELSKMQPLIDLNLPAPDEDEATGHTGFSSW